MFDDDCPDYFLGDDEPERTPTARQNAPRDNDDSNGRVIHFNDPEERTHAGSDDDADDEEIPLPGGCLPLGGGCLSLGTKGGGCGCSFMSVLMAGLVVMLFVAYFRYFSPHVTHASMDVRVEKVCQQGILFKTNEAVVVDSNGLRTKVSIPSTRLSQQLQRLQGTDSIVHVYYEEYYAPVAWRGESTIILTD